MSHDETMRMGGQQPPRQPPHEDSPEVTDAGETPGYMLPPPAIPPSPVEGNRPQAIGKARTEVLLKPPQVMAWLALKSGPRAGRLCRLSPDVTTIGRDSFSDVILDDSAVSRNHAKVRLERGDGGEEQFYIHDLASANGILVNGKQIVREALYDGDEIEIGRTVLVFKQMDGPRRASGAPIDEEDSAAEDSAADDSETVDLELV
jgi:hypothetical protein